MNRAEFPTVFRNMPNPGDPVAPNGSKCDVLMDEGVWRHVIRRHGDDPPGPWNAWLTERCWAALCSAFSKSGHEVLERPLAAAAISAVEASMRECLERPLVITRSGPSLSDAWELVLRNGGLLVIKTAGGRRRVCTVYFPDCARDVHPSRCWLVVAYWMLNRRASFDPTHGRAPKPGIRFVTPETWGWKGVSGRQTWRLVPWWGDPVPSSRGKVERLCPSVRRVV